MVKHGDGPCVIEKMQTLWQSIRTRLRQAPEAKPIITQSENKKDELAGASDSDRPL